MMIEKFKDAYINNTIFFDILGAIIIILFNSIPGIFTFYINEKEDNISILSDIISTAISLAGFILAALTVIVSMRSNIGNKIQEHAKNPMEMFFSDNNYNKILKTFQLAIIELVIIFLLSYSLWISIANISNETLTTLLIAFFFLIGVCIIRTLSVLFLVIGLDKQHT